MGRKKVLKKQKEDPRGVFQHLQRIFPLFSEGEGQSANVFRQNGNEAAQTTTVNSEGSRHAVDSGLNLKPIGVFGGKCT